MPLRACPGSKITSCYRIATAHFASHGKRHPSQHAANSIGYLPFVILGYTRAPRCPLALCLRWTTMSNKSAMHAKNAQAFPLGMVGMPRVRRIALDGFNATPHLLQDRHRAAVIHFALEQTHHLVARCGLGDEIE